MAFIGLTEIKIPINNLLFSERSTTMKVTVSGRCKTETDITIRNQCGLNAPLKMSVVSGKRNF